MTALQKIVLGTPPAAVDGDPVRTASTKMNANVDVLNQQATLTSFATTLTAAQALTAANHLGKRVNINLAVAGTINLPAANTCVADGVILLRNLGGTLVTLAITTGSGDTIALTALAAGESALMDTDGAHAWNCLTRGRPGSLNETVLGALASAGFTNTTGAYSGPAFDYSPSTANTAGFISARPSGTAAVGGFQSFGATDKANSAYVSMYQSGVSAIINTSKTGTGVAAPLDIYANSIYTARFTSASAVPQLILGSGTPVLGTASLNITSSLSGYHIGYLNPGAASGHIWLSGPNSANNFVLFNGSLVGVYVADGATAWAGQSDERLKNIRSEISGALDAVNDIRTVRYTWKSDDDHAEALNVENDSRVYVGVIAQDVQKHVPEAVSVSHDDYLGVAYTDLVPLCMAAIKELSAKLDSAQAQITALQVRAA